MHMLDNGIVQRVVDLYQSMHSEQNPERACLLDLRESALEVARKLSREL